jgi:hypothetical protein
MTVATELLALSAPDHVRQSILGHEHGSVINRNYTQANLELMKDYLDQIDLGLIVEFDRRYGFPVIRGCALMEEQPLRVTLALDAHDQPKSIEVYEPEGGKTRTILPERAVDPKDRASVAENLDQMGGRLTTLLAGRRYRIEGVVDQTVHRVLGVLLAVAQARPASEGPRGTANGVPAEIDTTPVGKSRIRPAPPAPRSRLQSAAKRLSGSEGSFATSAFDRVARAGP